MIDSRNCDEVAAVTPYRARSFTPPSTLRVDFAIWAFRVVLLFALALAVACVRREAMGAEEVATTPVLVPPTGGDGATNRSPLISTVKFRLQRGLVFLPAAVNRSEPLSFLLDTGYTITTIHPELVEPLHLTPAGKVTIVGIAGEENAPMYRGAEFQLGEAVYKPRRVAAVPSEAQRRRRRDGILGSGFFRQYVVELDFPTSTARLYDPEKFAYSGTGSAVPLEIRRDTAVLLGSIRLPDGKSVEGRFELDTGCDDGICLGSEFVRDHKLDAALSAERGGTKNGVGGDAAISSGRVPAIRLGESEARDVSASLFHDGSPAEAGLAGHVGMGTLRQFRVTIDYRRQKLFLEAARQK